MPKKKIPRPRGPYDRERQYADLGAETETRQDMFHQCDITSIYKRYQQTGDLPLVGNKQPEFMDVPEFDKHEHESRMAECKNAWEMLPDSLKTKYPSPAALEEGLRMPSVARYLASNGEITPLAWDALTSAYYFGHSQHEDYMYDPRYDPTSKEEHTQAESASGEASSEPKEDAGETV